MKTSELIEILQGSLEMNGDLEVMSSSNYGDYHNTEQLNDIMEIMPCTPVNTAYSQTGFAFPSNDEEEEETDCPDDREQVLVLRYTY